MRFGLPTMIGAGVTLSALMLGNEWAFSQTIRNYDVQFANTPPTIDGVVGAGEWDAASAGGDSFRQSGQPFDTGDDAYADRFRMLYDADNLYILYETDFSTWRGTNQSTEIPNPNPQGNTPHISLYIDPNRDGDFNINPNTGMPSDVNDSHNEGVDGYQLLVNQNAWTGQAVTTRITNAAGHGGVGVYTEAHVNINFGDQANWNRVDQGGNANWGALDGSGMVIAQTLQTIAGPIPGGVAEFVIPFADLDADAMIAGGGPDYNLDESIDAADYVVWRKTLGANVGGAGNGTLDGADGDDDGLVDDEDYLLWRSAFGTSTMIPTGLNATDGPSTGEAWGFQMSLQLNEGGVNRYVVWQWNNNLGFAKWPHGTLTFLAPPAGSASGAGVPEPSSIALLMIAATGLTALAGRK